MRRTYEDKDYWESVYASEENYFAERVITEGNDGEDEFDVKILNAASGKVILDVGCGDGSFSLKIAEQAGQVVGIDFSEQAIFRAQENLATNGKTNIRFHIADANKLPFVKDSFDMVVSRRGPITDSLRTLSEAYRILAKERCLMEITIGEKDKRNLIQIFGRGQMYEVEEKVALSKEKMLKEAGFKIIEIKEYMATEIFPSIRDLIIRLRSAPIVPDFDLKRDRKYLELIEKRCMSPKGIETEIHRVTIIAEK